MLKRGTRSQTDLRNAASHVTYEIEMLAYSGEELGGFHSSPMTTPAGADRNMALESFLLHFRNLRAFLCPSLQPIRADDILGSDFLNDPDGRDVVASSSFPTDDKERLDKMLAHLSYTRDSFIDGGMAGL